VQQIGELELPHLAMDEPEFGANPFPHFDAARAAHPWLATSNLGFVVTQYRAVRELMALEAGYMRTPYPEMVEMMGAAGTPWGRFQESHILARGGPEHKRLRDILAPCFTPRQANAHRPLMREVITRLLDEWAPKGQFDFEHFASHFPITVMCRLIGAPPEAIPGLRKSMDALALSVAMDPKYLPELQAATEEIDAFAHGLVEGREKAGPSGDEDLLDLFIEAKARGGMTMREICDLLIFFIVAGYDTSKNVLTLAMHELVQRPDVYARCAEDYAWCGKVIDETMRFHATTTTNRLLTAPIDYRGVHMPAGTTLWFPWSVIARDPAVAEDAHLFRPEREQANPHLGFALGAHMCIGQFVARAQLAEGLHLIAQRLRNPKSPGPLGWRPFIGVWGIAGLPVEFDPG